MTHNLNIVFQPTQRGFLKGEFKDLYGMTCSIQKSSLATDDAIWIGSDGGSHASGNTIIPEDEFPYTCMARMHLNREQVSELIPILQFFVDNGELPIKKIRTRK